MANAFDTTSSGSSATGSLSFSHTCTGTNLMLFAAIAEQQSTDGSPAPTVTYNGVAMTQCGHYNPSNTLVQTWLFYLVNPATGAHAFSSTLNGSGTVGKHEAVLASYTGAKQTGQPDATNAGEDAPSAFAGWSTSVTVATTNSWMISAVFGRGGSPVNQTSGASRVLFDSNLLGIGDSNAALSAGVQTISYSAGAGSPVYDWLTVSMAPASSAAVGDGLLMVND